MWNAWSCHVMMLAWRLWGRFQTWSLAGLNVVAQTYVLSSSTLWKLKVTCLSSIGGFQLTGIVCSFPVSGVFGWFSCVNTFEPGRLFPSLFLSLLDLRCKVFPCRFQNEIQESINCGTIQNPHPPWSTSHVRLRRGMLLSCVLSPVCSLGVWMWGSG